MLPRAKDLDAHKARGANAIKPGGSEALIDKQVSRENVLHAGAAQ
jgi:hypothetical protein